jgi:2-succinyl-5-enolpyruvyl-6-hydroxy-3-cyclohexene-1-carboxylate synthase
LEYLTASNEPTLNMGLKKLYKQNEKPVLLEVFTPTKDNDKILNGYFKSLV